MSVAAKKGTKMAAKWSPARGAVRSEPFPLLRSVVRNGPERSRARRCWARRSEPLTARTVLRGSLKRERRGARLAKSGPPFWYPRPPPLTVIQPRVFVRSQEEEPRVDQSGSPDRFGVSSPAKHLFPYHSPPGSQLRRLRAGRFARLPLGLERCQCSCGCGWHAMSAPITSVSLCSPRVATDLVRPERHVPSRELVWSRTSPFPQSSVEERWHRRAACLRLFH